MTTTKDISVNIVCMVVSMKRYWKTIWEDLSYMGQKESSFQKLTARRSAIKSSLQKPNPNYFLPFVICVDFESILCKQDSCEPSSSKPFTTHYQHHVPCGSCIYLKYSDGWYFDASQVNIRDEASEKFLDHVIAAATICRQHLANKIPMKRLTQE